MIQVMLTLMDLKALLNLTQLLQFIFGKLRMVKILVISNWMTSTIRVVLLTDPTLKSAIKEGALMFLLSKMLL